MDLGAAAGQALQQIFTLEYLIYMVIGVTIGNVVGVVPGIGGNFALAIMIPFIFWMDPVLAIAFLEGAHAATATGGAVTSILVNVPGDASNAATCFDGYQMTRKGQGGRAIGASAMASAVGGVIGAVFLLMLLPVVKPLVLALGPSELFAMVMVGIAMIAFVGEGSTGRALLSGGFGLLLSFIGADRTTGFVRFTFGNLYLRDGLDLVPVVIGVFAFSEMLRLIKDRQGIVQLNVTKASFAQVIEGCKDCFRHWWLMVRCSAIGTVIGMVPGLGGTVSSFVTYAHAVQTEKNPEEFGTGRVEGVIAPEAANNAKEGGNLIPTIAFGIPNNSSMALILGALMIVGLTPGPKMLTTELNFTLVIVWTLVIANVVAALQIILLANPMAKLAAIRPSIIVPVVLAIAALGSYAVSNDISNVLVSGVFGVVGYEMKRLRFSRATMIIGLVLGRTAEKNYSIAMDLFGPTFVFRPITLALLAFVALLMVWVTVKGIRKKAKEEADEEDE